METHGVGALGGSRSPATRSKSGSNLAAARQISAGPGDALKSASPQRSDTQSP